MILALSTPVTIALIAGAVVALAFVLIFMPVPLRYSIGALLPAVGGGLP